MTFEEMLDHALAMLQRRGRVSYRALQRQFALDEDALNDLKDELLYAHPEIHDDAGRGLVWSGDASPAPPASSPPARPLDRAPLTSMPPYLAEKILTSRGALEGERKQVTVLFADLKGSMELLAERDPEEARHLLDPVLGRMMSAVHQYEGTVNQVMGDGIMALFGAPLAHEDHVETGMLVGAPGAYRLAQPLAGLQMPATVQTVLAARIDRLPPEEKHVLQTAAVIGTEVPLPLLQAIAELPEPDLYRVLAPLQAAEFLYETRLFPERAFTFKHALTHEVAYNGLLQERRRVLHARIVEALEMLSPDRLAEQVERLAHHALRGEVWDKVLAYCRQAGERAIARSAHREAVGSFEQALSALPHLPETRDTRAQAIDLRLALRSALLSSGQVGRILTYLREAEALAEALDDPHRLGQLSNFLSHHFILIGASDQAIAAGQRALALATASGETVLRALANRYLGQAYHDQGDYRRAIDCFGQAVVFFDEAGCSERFGQLFLPAVLSRNGLADCHAAVGAFAEGRAFTEEGLQIAQMVAHPVSLMSVYWFIGLLSLRQGDLPRALPLLERAASLCREVDLPAYFPIIAAALSVAYTRVGRVADAVPLLTQVGEQVTAMERVDAQELCRLFLGEAQMLAGCLEEAQVLAEQALAHAHAHQERGNQAYALRLFGDIAARRDPPEVEQAEAHYHQTLALAEELGMRPLQAHCHLGLGTLYAKTGQRQQARTALSTAIEMYRAMAMTFWLPEAEAALGQMEGR